MSDKYVNRYFLGETEDDTTLEDREFVVLEQSPFKKVKVVDGYAAGGAWYQLSPLDGDFQGKKLWFEDCMDGVWKYHSGKTNDDGFIFNGDDTDKGSIVPGDSIQELDGVAITLVTPEYYESIEKTMELEEEQHRDYWKEQLVKFDAGEQVLDLVDQRPLTREEILANAGE